MIIRSAARLAVGLWIIAQVPNLHAQQGERPESAPGNRFALIVGVEEYPNPSKNLRQCTADARDMREALTSAGFRCTVLGNRRELGEPPTRKNVRDELSKVCLNAKREDLVLVYFSCHGGTRSNGPVLLLTDGDIPLADVKKPLADRRSDASILVIDACRHEPAFRTETKEHRKVFVMMGCAPEGFCYLDEKDPEKSKNSLFTRVFLERFREAGSSDSRLTFSELFAYVGPKVQSRARELFNQDQIPTYTVVDAEVCDVVLRASRGQPSAVSTGQPLTPVPHAVVLPSDYVDKVKFGMFSDEVKSSLGEPRHKTPFGIQTTQGFQKEDQRGVWVYDIAAERTLAVAFDGALVASVGIYPNRCTSGLDKQRARDGYRRLSKDASASRPNSPVFEALEGIRIDTILKEMGCPNAPGLWICNQDGRPTICASYVDMTNSGTHLTFMFRDGVVERVLQEEVGKNNLYTLNDHLIPFE